MLSSLPPFYLMIKQVDYPIANTKFFIIFIIIHIVGLLFCIGAQS